MKRYALVAAALLIAVSGSAVADSIYTTDEIRRMMIQASISSYSGNCPCPYNRASDGSRCGGRSAWSRPGGEAPLCYPDDISDAMVERFVDRHDLTVREPK